jgi:hypothetical protein
MHVRLEQIAWARSGDKGPNSNVGVLFRHEELYRWALEVLTEERVGAHLARIARGGVKRYELPNLLGLNFILLDSLGGGGSESLLNDAQGKTHGQALLQLELELPSELAVLVDLLPAEDL